MDILYNYVTLKLVVLGLVILILPSSWGFDYATASTIQLDSDDLTVGHIGNSNHRLVGCWPCSQAYLAEAYFEHHDSLLDLDFCNFLDKKFGSCNLCKTAAIEINVLEHSDLHWHLSGEGSHRHLVSTLRFGVHSDALSWLDDQYCETILVERLPTGVFADPFELHHLVHSKVFLDAAVFGDTNLELPSALSNRSVVEIHRKITLNTSMKTFETFVELPLHARYPPLDACGYAKVEIGKPDLFLRCRPKEWKPDPCSWTLMQLFAGSSSRVMWLIPAGNDQHRGLVSSITFLSSLICALLIVLSSIHFSRNYEVKED